MSTSDSRLKVLMGKYVITGMREDLGEGIAYCLNALTCLTAYFYRVVQMLLLILSIYNMGMENIKGKAHGSMKGRQCVSEPHEAQQYKLVQRFV